MAQDCQCLKLYYACPAIPRLTRNVVEKKVYIARVVAQHSALQPSRDYRRHQYVSSRSIRLGRVDGR